MHSFVRHPAPKIAHSIPRRPTFFCDPRRGGARQVRRKTPCNNRQSRFRARLPRACEHARMDADLFGAAVALCNLLERRRRNHARPRLDRRPCLIFRWLQQGRGEATARLLHPGDGVPFAVRRRHCRRFHAFVRRLRSYSCRFIRPDVVGPSASRRTWT